MKIICIGRNYVKHIEELKNEKPKEPIAFLKPATSLLFDSSPFELPKFDNDIHHEIEIVLRVSQKGKYIKLANAYEYCDSIALGVDFTARTLQSKLKSKGLPWTLAKGFDGAAPLSSFFPKSKFDLESLPFQLFVDGKIRQDGNTKHMIFSFAELISYISEFMTLEVGDLIFTGTPSGVAKVQVGNRLEGYLNGNKVLDFQVV